MSCPPDKIIYDHEYSAYICAETGEVLDDRPIVQLYQPSGGEGEGELPILVNSAVHDYGVGGEVSRLDYGEARAVTLHHILGEMVKQLGLPRYVQEDAAGLIKELLKRRLTQGRRTRELVAATIYASVRRYGLPVELGELCGKLGVDKGRVWNYYKVIHGELGLRQEPVPIRVYVVRVASEFGLDPLEYQIADSILSRLPPDLKYSRRPLAVAQAVVLIARLIRMGLRGGEE
jgi:transcription initiation factor TFIIIB Brf1 subunit/transcription initiation factor TFIIB